VVKKYRAKLINIQSDTSMRFNRLSGYEGILEIGFFGQFINLEKTDGFTTNYITDPINPKPVDGILKFETKSGSKYEFLILEEIK
jgi:hypothetical protein